MSRLLDKLNKHITKHDAVSYIRSIVTGSVFRTTDTRGNTSITDIKSKIDTMRGLARDSQIATALSYYATDATTTNTSGQILWATSDNKQLADIINGLFKKWNINSYARDHILELATIGNLYIPTTDMYKESTYSTKQIGIALDNNTIPNRDFDIIPSYKIPPEDVLHLWYQGQPCGYMYAPDDDFSGHIRYPESSIIHFSLGGILGDYTIDTKQADGSVKTWDIMFAEPLMSNAISPTQTLNLLEDATLLSSLSRVVRFVNVDCGDSNDEEAVTAYLQQIKDAIEQNLSINTSTGDVQSFVNPQSPNNLIYLPKRKGQDIVSITDLNMADFTEADNNLLEYYQNKKLSVLGVPKEAMNFSSNEGLGGAGSVMSQRSALYANILTRIETAYKAGWTSALNTYFKSNNMSAYADNFELHMNPIITTQSTIQFDKRDSALSQADTFVNVLKNLGVTKSDAYREGLSEILTEGFPQMGSDANGWRLNLDEGDDTSEL